MSWNGCPSTLGGDAGELRRLRDQLARAPTDMAQAVAVAGRYIELGQSQTDPRYYGYAQAALAPWWGLADPPSEVLLLRAAIRQSRHEFDPALQDLSRLLEKDPRDPQAWLMQAVILIVRGDYRGRPASLRGPRATAPGLPRLQLHGQRGEPLRSGRGRLRTARARKGAVTGGHAGRAGAPGDVARQDRGTDGRSGTRRGPFPGGPAARPPRCLSPRGRTRNSSSTRGARERWSTSCAKRRGSMVCSCA